MNVPQPLAHEVSDASFAGLTYHIGGALVPQLHVEVNDNARVYFEHHILLWKEPAVEIEVHKLPGGLKRKFAGGDFFVTQTKGNGHVAFSRDSPGQLFALHIPHGQAIDVREHQFVAATNGMNYGFEHVKGMRNRLFSGTGFFMDKFEAKKDDGIVWIHGHGNVFVVDLAAGEKIDVEPGGWLFKDHSVKMESHTSGLKTGLLGGGERFTWNRFVGPGRVGIQSMYFESPGVDTAEE